jgi:hypothetical protein
MAQRAYSSRLLPVPFHGLFRCNSTLHRYRRTRRVPDIVPGRSHNETGSGCIVFWTAPVSSRLRVPRSVPSLSLAEKASGILAASYFCL